jgi:FlaA1/EpsC-like NDP-sugar epimerase
VIRLVKRLRTRTAAFIHDLCMVPLAWLGAFLLRFNLDTIPAVYLEQALRLLPVVVGINALVFWAQGLYRGVWRFASVPDLVRIVKAVVIGAAVSAVVVFLWTRMFAVPRSVLPLFGLLLVGFLTGPRLAYRWLKGRQLVTGTNRSVLIVGAGAAGEAFVRELRRDQRSGFNPIGFVDDDAAKRGLEIQGVRVLAKCGRLERVVSERSVDLIVLAIPSATPAQRRAIVALCERTGLPVRSTPELSDLISGRARAGDLRELSIEDLLGREAVSLGWDEIEAQTQSRVVLVTGGAGSIGSELCRQLAKLGPSRLVVVDRNEYGLYAIDDQLRQDHPNMELHVHLRDVCDRVAMDDLFAIEQPDLVFHAAAYKHVPMLEFQVREAIRNNVLGARNVAECAVEAGTQAVVLISTDKAVNPTNVMGATKRIAEIYCQNADQHAGRTRFVTVRFGNVLDSAGSVVPRFRRQIADGGPVTVTHPEIERYFMTIPEASQLILEAGAIGQGGEIFVLDMGEPVRIAYLAEQMIALAGKRPHEDIAIVYTGLRPGEKLFEELFHENENLAPTGRHKLLLARVRAVEWGPLNSQLDNLLESCDRYDEDDLRRRLSELVPEYRAALVNDMPARKEPTHC